MSLTVANLRNALQRGSVAHIRDPYWTTPHRIVWRTPSEMFAIATLYGIIVIALLKLVTLIA